MKDLFEVVELPNTNKLRKGGVTNLIKQLSEVFPRKTSNAKHFEYKGGIWQPTPGKHFIKRVYVAPAYCKLVTELIHKDEITTQDKYYFEADGLEFHELRDLTSNNIRGIYIANRKHEELYIRCAQN